MLGGRKYLYSINCSENRRYLLNLDDFFYGNKIRIKDVRIFVHVVDAVVWLLLQIKTKFSLFASLGLFYFFYS